MHPTSMLFWLKGGGQITAALSKNQHKASWKTGGCHRGRYTSGHVRVNVYNLDVNVQDCKCTASDKIVMSLYDSHAALLSICWTAGMWQTKKRERSCVRECKREVEVRRDSATTIPPHTQRTDRSIHFTALPLYSTQQHNSEISRVRPSSSNKDTYTDSRADNMQTTAQWSSVCCLTLVLIFIQKKKKDIHTQTLAWRTQNQLFLCLSIWGTSLIIWALLSISLLAAWDKHVLLLALTRMVLVLPMIK